MKIDKNNPQSWILYRKNLCSQCLATCCTMPLEITAEDLVQMKLITMDDLENLSPKKIITKMATRHIYLTYRKSTQLFMVGPGAKEGECPFLDLTTRKCTLYAHRPQVCRDFPISKGSRLGYCPYQLNPETQ